MVKLNAYVVLIVIVSIVGISQCSDDCFYHPGHAGKKCYNEQNAKYTCCPLDHHCTGGKCISLNASPPTSHLPVYTDVLISVGVAVFAAVVIVIIGAIYWHRKQLKMMERPHNALASFSNPTNAPIRSGSSVGFRARTTVSPPSSPEASVSIHIPSITNSSK